MGGFLVDKLLFVLNASYDGSSGCALYSRYGNRGVVSVARFKLPASNSASYTSLVGTVVTSLPPRKNAVLVPRKAFHLSDPVRLAHGFIALGNIGSSITTATTSTQRDHLVLKGTRCTLRITPITSVSKHGGHVDNIRMGKLALIKGTSRRKAKVFIRRSGSHLRFFGVEVRGVCRNVGLRKYSTVALTQVSTASTIGNVRVGNNVRGVIAGSLFKSTRNNITTHVSNRDGLVFSRGGLATRSSHYTDFANYDQIGVSSGRFAKGGVAFFSVDKRGGLVDSGIFAMGEDSGRLGNGRTSCKIVRIGKRCGRFASGAVRTS